MFYSTIFLASSALGVALGLPVSLEKRDPAQSPIRGQLVGGYPRAIKLDNGQFLGTSGGGTGGVKAFLSWDGFSWDPIGGAVTVGGAANDRTNGFPYQRPGDGKYLVAYRDHDVKNGVDTVWRITISEYDVDRWNYLSNADVKTNEGSETGDWEPFLRTSSDGSTIQLFYSHELSANVQYNVMKTSNDGGKSWSDVATTVSDGDNGTRRDGMVGVAEIDSEHLIAVFESLSTQSGTQGYIGSVESFDGGKTWDQQTRTVVHQPADGATIGAPQILKVGNNLVVSFQSNGPSGGSIDARLIYKPVSEDKWSDLITVMPSSEWNGLTAIDDSSFLYLCGNGVVERWRFF